MLEDQVQATVIAAQRGNAEARDAVITEYRDWVESLARRSRWDGTAGAASDEFSIALLALNEAIDSFRPGKKSFRSFAYLVVTNRLRDHYRREARHRHLPLRPALEVQDGELVEYRRKEELRQAWVQYREQEAARERARELSEFRLELRNFGIELHDLPSYSPQHRDTRHAMIAVARTILESPDLRDRLFNTGQLPLTALGGRVEVSGKTLERWRQFIIAVAVALAHPEWEELSAFFGPAQSSAKVPEGANEGEVV